MQGQACLSFFLVHLVTLIVLQCSSVVQGQRLGVIGAGIGGAATAYYAHKLNPNLEITVFERSDYIGGRLKHIVIDGATVEGQRVIPCHLGTTKLI